MENLLLYVVLCGFALFGGIQLIVLAFNEIGKKVSYDVVIPLSSANADEELVVKSVVESGVGSASNPHIIFVCNDNCQSVHRIIEEEGAHGGRYTVLTKYEYAVYMDENQ